MLFRGRKPIKPLKNILLLGFWASGHCSLVPITVLIREFSTSGRTILIDRGKTHSINKGMRATFIRPVSATTFHKEMVGWAEAVKVHERQSVWYFINIVHPEHLVWGKPVEMFTWRDNLRGSVSPRILRHRQVMLPAAKGAEALPLGRDRSIIKRDGAYEEVVVPLELPREDAPDEEVFDLARWTEGRPGIFSARPLQTGPSKERVTYSIQEKRQLQMARHFLRRGRGEMEVKKQPLIVERSKAYLTFNLK